MTFDEIVDMVAKDMGITAPASITRIGTHVNARYRKVMRRLGLDVYSRVELDFDCQAGSREQEVVDDNVPSVQKVKAVWFQPSTSSRFIPLDDLTYDEMMERVVGTGDPTAWAPKRMGAHNIVFLLDSTVNLGCSLVLECEEVASTLSGDDEPGFLVAFHEMLVKGAKGDEYAKMEKFAAAKTFKDEFEIDLNELSLKTVLSAHKTIQQGKTRARSRRFNGTNDAE